MNNTLITVSTISPSPSTPSQPPSAAMPTIVQRRATSMTCTVAQPSSSAVRAPGRVTKNAGTAASTGIRMSVRSITSPDVLRFP
jgi:hypothetical protein